ncbi:hypothetical protein KKC08_01240 [Patescibacteria group bacterium]|nr:hypothetical protein [Patescibacteria group bacterium]MCG2702157.1 hypothetical protein [Candidatus Parcubacteria bacterium]MBU4264806.1 hypothetical protein [Patescibacteria group bacterium]MBU4390144.1 hypothetical protein [Patescibacteria group bacterium]MBU4396777.1 hypothetical protein [Patescibacteria group bacterium]
MATKDGRLLILIDNDMTGKTPGILEVVTNIRVTVRPPCRKTRRTVKLITPASVVFQPIDIAHCDGCTIQVRAREPVGRVDLQFEILPRVSLGKCPFEDKQD